MKNDWAAYYKTTKSKPPKPLLMKAVGFVARRGSAIDIGAGALNETRYLLEQGFEVTAIDKSPLVAEEAKTIPSNKLHVHTTAAEDFDFPADTYDLACAMFSLPFISPKSFDQTFDKIRTSIKKGGIFCGQLFGVRDQWSNNPEMAFHTKERCEALLKRFEVLSFQEVENDALAAAGTMKHWHVFHIIARK